ncbi:energy transducer TonB [Psychromonas sp. SP041]|uniref:energy transducer TonB n=1 Tax=Psychromonas sp. SP041 TaxID=1365007 RepID=UPI0004078C61|nr:energy transducer TonB [Psychromonas sp. SP041]
MKNSYYYFPFIVLSLLLHYLFFYFHGPSPSNDLAIESTQPVIKTKEHVAVSTQLKIKEITQSQSQSQSNVVKPSPAVTPTAVNQATNTTLITTSTTLPQETKIDLIAETAVLKKEVKKTEVEVEVEVETGFEINKLQPKKGDSKSIKTHNSSEVSLLKEHIFKQNLVNLPELVVAKKSKAHSEVNGKASGEIKRNTQPKDTANKTNQKIVSLNTTSSQNKTSTPTQRNSNSATKRVFKPKSDAINTSMAKQGNLLPQATAVSGKTPSYPKQAALQHQKGQVVANMTVTVSGSTKEAKIIQSSGHEMLDKEVLSFIARERFMPALEGQEKVSSKQSFSYSFK